MEEQLKQYKGEVENELKNILQYWMEHTLDKENGGFFGRVDNSNKVYKEAPKGSVLNSRILWSFSAAFNHNRNEQYLEMADRAYHYLVEHFIDKEYGGIYWSVDYSGKPLDTKKQIYALAFAIYGLSEYARATGSIEAKSYAIDLYHTIEKYSHDKVYRGYIEALNREWKEINDLRLSAKDQNERKSMNTHLHIVEGYANLYRVWPNQELKRNIEEVIHLFLDHIIDKKSKHLVLFFDDEWNQRSGIISYGHDIEAAWLLQEAADAVGDEALLNEVRTRSIEIANAAKQGLDNDGGLWYESNADTRHLVKEKHWWVQAEAMVGFLNTWQITGEEKYLQLSLNNWQFTKQYLINRRDGEWFWGVKEDLSVMKDEDKVGIWKCPYHNSRACIEIARRMSTLSDSD